MIRKICVLLALAALTLLTACAPSNGTVSDGNGGSMWYQRGPNGEKCLMWNWGYAGGMECDTVNWPDE